MQAEKQTNQTRRSEIVRVQVERSGYREQERTRIAKAKFLEAYIKSACNISMGCRAANICRANVYDWIEKDKNFREALNDAKEALIDLAESKLYEAIISGNIKAIIFFLERKAKNRGYGQSVEQDTTTHYYIHEVDSKK